MNDDDLPTVAEWQARRQACFRRRAVFTGLLFVNLTTLAIALVAESLVAVLLAAVGLGIAVAGRVITNQTVALVDLALLMTRNYEREFG